MIRYNFVGEISLPKETSKRPFVRSFDKNGRKMKSMSFGVKSDRTNMGFVELFGSQQDVIKVYDTDNNPVEIDWSDRNDPDTVSHVRPSNQFIVHLGPDYGEKRFITALDMIEYLEEELPNFNGIVRVSGQARHDFYNGRSRVTYQLKNVFAVDPNVKVERGLFEEIDYYWSLNDIDVDKSANRIDLNGYVQEYISKDEGNKFVSTPIVYIPNRSTELEESRHKYIVKILKMAPKNKVVHCNLKCELKNGSDEIPFDESQLTDLQKESLELGLATLDDFKPRGQILGQRVTEIRLKSITLRDNFAAGPIDTEMKPSEFEENVYVPPTIESIKDVLPKKDEDPKAAPKTSSGYGVDPDAIQIDDDDLF